MEPLEPHMVIPKLDGRLDERLARANSDIKSMSSGIDHAISGIQQWRIAQQQALERQLKHLHQEMENEPPASHEFGTIPTRIPPEVSCPMRPLPSPKAERDENLGSRGTQARQVLRPSSSNQDRWQARAAPGGSAALAARAALLFLSEEKDAAALREAVDVEPVCDPRHEMLANEAAEFSRSAREWEDKLLEFSSGVDDMLSQLEMLDGLHEGR